MFGKFMAKMHKVEERIQNPLSERLGVGQVVLGDPWKDFDKAFEDMDRAFEAMPGTTTQKSETYERPNVSVKIKYNPETKDQFIPTSYMVDEIDKLYMVYFTVPGVPEDHIDVQKHSDGVFTVEVLPPNFETKFYTRPFKATIELNDVLSQEYIRATVRDGVLSIQIARRMVKSAKPMSQKVHVEKG